MTRSERNLEDNGAIPTLRSRTIVVGVRKVFPLAQMMFSPRVLILVRVD